MQNEAPARVQQESRDRYVSKALTINTATNIVSFCLPPRRAAFFMFFSFPKLSSSLHCHAAAIAQAAVSKRFGAFYCLYSCIVFVLFVCVPETVLSWRASVFATLRSVGPHNNRLTARPSLASEMHKSIVVRKITDLLLKRGRMCTTCTCDARTVVTQPSQRTLANMPGNPLDCSAATYMYCLWISSLGTVWSGIHSRFWERSAFSHVSV